MNMTQHKLLFLLLLLLLPLTLSAQTNTFIMWAEGNGDTIKDAKASAVTALSQQVISKVESSFKTELSVKNEDVNRDSKSIKQIKSNLILKGVIYVDEVRSGGNIKITAGLDRSAILSTVDYMKKQLEVDFNILSRDNKEAALVISDQLTAFVSVLPGSILNDFDNIEAWNKNKRDLLLKSINMGRILFVSNTPDYTVKVDEKPVSSGVFLEAGNYQFAASADGYRKMSGRFSASSGETIKVKLDFIKTISNKNIRLKLPANYAFLSGELEDTLADLGINVQPDASNSLSVKIKDTVTAVDGYLSHDLIIRIEANKNTARIKRVTVRTDFIVQKGEVNTVKNKTNKLLRKGVVALLSKMDLDAYFGAN